MRLSCIGIIILGLLSFQCVSQTGSTDTLPSSAAMPATPKYLSKQNKMHVNVMAGTEFWTATGYGSGIATYLMTGITYPVGKRFSLGGGIGILNTTPVGVHSTSVESFGNANSTNTLVYITGQYLLSQHVTVSGTVFKEFTAFNNSPEYQRSPKNTPQGVYMKVDYRINDFMQIEAGFGYSRGVSPYYNSYTGSPLYDRPSLLRNP